MEKADGRNQTPIAEFILLGFGDVGELQPLVFLMFLVIYLVTLSVNFLIIALIVTNHKLHIPMYFFLGNLACLEISFSTTILPRYLTSLLTGVRTVPVKGCIVQLYFFGVMSTTENLLLAAMSYDRYLAICHPLRYGALMNGSICGQLVAGAWIISLASTAVVNNFLYRLMFCDFNEIDHFFCDFTPMLKLSCSDTQLLQQLGFAFSLLWTLGPLLLTLVSYICIITTILQIPSSVGRKKAFSTCSSHLVVVTFKYVIVTTLYVVPIVKNTKIQKKIFSIFCTLMSPMINPIVYCLRNKEVKDSLRKTLQKIVALKNKKRI